MIFPRAEPQAAVRCPAVSNYPHFLDISGCSGTHHDQKLEQCRQQTWRPVLSDRYSDPEQQRWSRHHKVIKIVRVEVVEVEVVALRVEATAGERGKVSDTEKMLIKEF